MRIYEPVSGIEGVAARCNENVRREHAAFADGDVIVETAVVLDLGAASDRKFGPWINPQIGATADLDTVTDRKLAPCEHINPGALTQSDTRPI